MKSISHGIVSSRIRSAMKKTAPLSTPTSSRSRPSYSLRDLGAELCDPRLQRLLLDQDLADRVLHRLHVTAPSQPGASATPGTATTSSPRTTSGQPSRSALGTFASTNRSCTFFRRPASRSPGRRARTSSPVRSDAIVHGPHSTEPSSRSVPYSRTARTPAPRSADLVPSRLASSSASVRSSVRGSRGRSSASESSEARARGSSRSSSGRISFRIRPRFVPGFDESSRYGEPALVAVGARLLPPDAEQRPHDRRPRAAP